MNAELLMERTVKEIIIERHWEQNLQESFSLVTQDYIFQCTEALAYSLYIPSVTAFGEKANSAKPGIPSPEQQHLYQGANINNNKNVTRLLKQTQPNDNEHIARPSPLQLPPRPAPYCRWQPL